jgi:hypothetical protein
MSEPIRKTDEEGREILVYDNGTVKDARTGHFLRGVTDPALNPVLADPQGMRRRGLALSQQKTQEAIDLETGIDPSKHGTGEGWLKLSRKVARLILDATDPAGVAPLYRSLGIAAGYLRKETTEKAPSGVLYGSPHAILELVRQIEAEQAARDAQARAVDGVET